MGPAQASAWSKAGAAAAMPPDRRLRMGPAAPPRDTCAERSTRPRPRLECRTLSLSGPAVMIAWFGLPEAGSTHRRRSGRAARDHDDLRRFRVSIRALSGASVAKAMLGGGCTLGLLGAVSSAGRAPA